MIVTTITPINSSAEVGKRQGSNPNVLGTSVSPIHSPIYFDRTPQANPVIVTTIGQGIKGDPGPPGPAGGDWLTGSGTPDNSLGNDGQIYYATGTGDVYKKQAGVWERQFAITGKSFYYEHTQSVASDMWTVNHNKGSRPSIAVYSAGGKEIWAEIIHNNVNQALIYFDSAITGSAICT